LSKIYENGKPPCLVIIWSISLMIAIVSDRMEMMF
jgi:hypothetical protein